MPERTWTKYFAEGVLIVFSVLLALFLSQVVENRKIAKQKEEVLQSIHREVSTNMEAVQHLRQKHQGIYSKIVDIREGREDSLLTGFREADYFNIGLITDGEPIVDHFISNTSWETAQSMGVVSEFEYELVEKLTLVYALQDIVINQTLKSITELFFERETHKMQNMDETLIQLQLRFNELIGQEYYLIELLNEATEYMNSSGL